MELINKTTITVSREFKEILGLHGRYGETQEVILIRLLPKEFTEKFSGDKKSVTYSKDDIDSKKTKKERIMKNG